MQLEKAKDDEHPDSKERPDSDRIEEEHLDVRIDSEKKMKEHSGKHKVGKEYLDSDEIEKKMKEHVDNETEHPDSENIEKKMKEHSDTDKSEKKHSVWMLIRHIEENELKDPHDQQHKKEIEKEKKDHHEVKEKLPDTIVETR